MCSFPCDFSLITLTPSPLPSDQVPASYHLLDEQPITPFAFRENLVNWNGVAAGKRGTDGSSSLVDTPSSEKEMVGASHSHF
ncbi:hypothetical protein FRX31_005248 [Thalictrum thalictroides]|uniref:Uncharacterized protein n=1 Tax=Thalictrum thalictroides TaxID=46969 RepID=A0A7J6X5T3_THATH|nr:hypothetical protein FRX31_005248 [Thalictrum thalictroides]